MRKVRTCLWFEGTVEEPMRYYQSIFPDAVAREHSPVAGELEVGGHHLMLLGGRRGCEFTDAASVFVECEDQAEVDGLWTQLTAGGVENQCGWLRDRYGVAWQIIPRALLAYLGSDDRAKAARVTEAMLRMRKIDVAELDRVAAGAA